MRFFNAGVVALIISVLALGVSLTTLWFTHLAPGHLDVAHASVRITGYPTELKGSDGIPVLRPMPDVEMAYYNSGQRAAEVLGLRIRVARKGAEDIFYPEWVVDRTRFQASVLEFDTWTRTAIEHEWFRVLVPGKTTIYQHVVFGGNLWRVPISTALEVYVEVLERGRPWRRLSLQRFLVDWNGDKPRFVLAHLPTPFNMSDGADESWDNPAGPKK